MNRLLSLILLLFIISCANINNGKMKQLDYKYRNAKLNSNEIDLIESTGLNIDKFNTIFNDIIISELKTNSIKLGKNKRDSISGILFCGKVIEHKKVLDLRNELSKKYLILEVSLNELSDRFFDFEFPFYKKKEDVIDIKKQYYKIYKKTQIIDFIEQIEYSQDDKTIITKVYNNWVKEINVFPIWADQNENVLFCPMNQNDEIIDIIYKGQVEYLESAKVNLEKGWVTEKSMKEEIIKKFPKIDFWYY